MEWANLALILMGGAVASCTLYKQIGSTTNNVSISIRALVWSAENHLLERGNVENSRKQPAA